jgi:hypothetical protein
MRRGAQSWRRRRCPAVWSGGRALQQLSRWGQLGIAKGCLLPPMRQLCPVMISGESSKRPEQSCMCQVESHATAFLSTCSTVTIVVWLATEQQFCKASRRASRPNRQTGFAVFRTHSAPVPLVVQAGHSAGSTQQGMRQAVHLGLCPLRALSVLPGTCSSHQRGATRLHALRPVLFPSNLHSGPNIWRPSKVHHTSCCECLLRSLAHGCCCDSAASSSYPCMVPITLTMPPVPQSSVPRIHSLLQNTPELKRITPQAPPTG